MSTIAQQTQTRVQVDELRVPLVGALVMLGLLGYVFWEFLHRQYRWAIEEPSDWGHTLVIPAIAGYFVYLSWDKILARGFRTTWLGLVPLIVGLAAYMFFVFGPQAWHHHNLHGLGFTISLFGLVLLFVGWRSMALLWFPLAYVCVFGQTVSKRAMDMVTEPLQDIAARGSHYGLVVLGADVDRTGNVLKIFKGAQEIPLNIAEACSGMRMLMAFLALGVAMGITSFIPPRPVRPLAYFYTNMTGWARQHPALRVLLALPAAPLSVVAFALDLILINWQRVLLVLLAIPVAIFVNILRVMTLALLSLLDTGFAAGDFHSFIGLVWLVPAFLIYLGVIWVLHKLLVEDDSPRPRISPQGAA